MTTDPSTPTEAPGLPAQNDPIPKYSASGVPVNRWYRLAFQIWVICFLLTIVITLVFYLYDKSTLAIGRYRL